VRQSQTSEIGRISFAFGLLAFLLRGVEGFLRIVGP
jgi:hypothetical protein